MGFGDGFKVAPSSVGMEVVGCFDGAEDGQLEGRLDVGRTDGCDVGLSEGCAEGDLDGMHSG